MKKREVTEKPGDHGPPSPIVPAYSNFQTARRMHADNLEHQPLPDAVADKAYRRLQVQGLINPGMALDIIPQVTGKLNKIIILITSYLLFVYLKVLVLKIIKQDQHNVQNLEYIVQKHVVLSHDH